MNKKICYECKKLKSLKDFSKDKYRKDGLCYRCKTCMNKKSRLWVLNHSVRHRINAHIYYCKNKNKVNERASKHYYDNPEKSKIRTNIWRKNNPDRAKEIAKKSRIKLYSNPKYKLNRNIATAVYLSLRGIKNGNHWEDLVGYNLKDLKIYLEGLFKEKMNWFNYGKWHIDHIIPVSLWEFSSYNDREFMQCWALCNLQPLWAKENISKCNRIIKE